MASVRMLAENLKTRLLVKRFLNGNFDPVKFRSRVEAGDPVSGSSRVDLGQSYIEVWGEKNYSLTILYIPGGGFCFGPSDDHREFLTDVGAELGAQTGLLRYRLAPENPFPAAFDDVVSALKYVSDHNTGPIVIVADSAGAALSLSAMMSLRDEGLPFRAACAVYLSAYTDLAHTGISLVDNANKDPLFGAQALIHKAHNYLQGHNPTDPKSSPFWGNPTGLPPSLFLVGSTEVLLNDSTRMVERGNSCGCDLRLKIYEHAPHDFALNARLPEAKQARAEVVEYIREYVGRIDSEADLSSN